MRYVYLTAARHEAQNINVVGTALRMRVHKHLSQHPVADREDDGRCGRAAPFSAYRYFLAGCGRGAADSWRRVTRQSAVRAAGRTFVRRR